MMEIASHERRLKEIQAGKDSTMKKIGHLDHDIKKYLIRGDEKQPIIPQSLETLYTKTIEKHGNENCLLHMEICLLQQHVQLAIRELDVSMLEAELFPLVEELSTLQSHVCTG